MKKVITIAREFGAGGTTIAKRLSEELGIEYYDKDLIMRTADMDPRLDTGMVAHWEKKTPSNLKFLEGLYDFYTKPMDDQILRAQKEAILQMANKESCIIVGRNANYILKDFDHSLHVFLTADFRWRVNRMTELTPGMTREEMTLQTKDIDRARRKFYEFHTGLDYGDARHFDLCLNTQKLGFEACVKLILDAAELI